MPWDIPQDILHQAPPLSPRISSIKPRDTLHQAPGYPPSSPGISSIKPRDILHQAPPLSPRISSIKPRHQAPGYPQGYPPSSPPSSSGIFSIKPRDTFHDHQAKVFPPRNLTQNCPHTWFDKSGCGCRFPSSTKTLLYDSLTHTLPRNP